MDRQEEIKDTNKKFSRMKIAIIILSVLLVLSLGGLAARYIYLNFFTNDQTTATVPENIITNEQISDERQDEPPLSADQDVNNNDDDASADLSEDDNAADSKPKPENKPVFRPAATLELFKGNPEDNEKFEAVNMFPGDMLTKQFAVKVHHSADVEVFFKVEVTEQTKLLADVLKIKVTHLESGIVLCDAPFAEVNGKEFSQMFKVNSEKETAANYKIDVSLDTSVGNEYQNALLKADFNWYVKDKGALIPPKTGDTSNIILWTVLILSSLALIILLVYKRRKERENSGQ